MKIAIIMCGTAVEAGGGVRIQGLMWRDGLYNLGHQVDLINFWESYHWESYDAIIVLQHFGCFYDIVSQIYKHNPNIIVAPIIDPAPNMSIRKYRFYAKYMRFAEIIGLSSNNIHLYNGSKFVSLFLTRSNIETEYLSRAFDVPVNKIRIVPLSLRFKPLTLMPQKEDFCFHVSRLAAPNKNVARLIEASKIYNFNLKLAGVLHGDSEKEWLIKLIGDCTNIEYVGELSDQDLINYYKRAKVFALPSTMEGVGMVALEAAGHGCEVVLTNIEGPKDYFQSNAKIIDPYDVHSIGKAVLECLNVGYSQPSLLKYINENYTLNACAKKLEKAILNLP